MAVHKYEALNHDQLSLTVGQIITIESKGGKQARGEEGRVARVQGAMC